MKVARSFPRVELLSIDSMQVYRGMNVGTAKPSTEEQSEVAHHLIDLVAPTESFTLVDFQNAYATALSEITKRDGIPVLVGGTGLYLRAVLDGLSPPPRFEDLANELERESNTEALHERLVGLDPTAAGRMESSNRRRIIRALEVTIGTGRPFSSFGPGLNHYPEVPYRVVGIEIERAELDERITNRYEQQIEEGFLAEVEALSHLQLSRTASQALGYRELLLHVRGELSLSEALELAVQRTKRFARRQQRWFRRDPRVEWVTRAELPNVINGISSQ
ncbi:MAG: tRNA (adenosine(37)-N6)-dimethylallyltransferase MiaA [Acidimicrobiales bacterium]|jgi:tRNA dimethylallyltransferase|nr:tRNA (adenosine(37)-N6)-dimethylallyltransferase MiaA [Acidimicrobiales bacterium]HCK74191.1 tRNA (adenosine(37)-N6)-dimethylallyltransferase MiaA [Acidimicrobiaceae bacterium]|tara:strand:- start:11950 stop:12780 length:831 start_codon:yes stop_codon:yes gene_type:complete